MEKICMNCKYWGYNNGKAMNSVAESKCLKLNCKTHACGKCSKNFEEKVLTNFQK